MTFLRVMAAPAYSNRAANPYNAQLYKELARLGVAVEEYGVFRCVFGRRDILHMHWPDNYVNEKRLWKTLQRTSLVAMVVMTGRLKGTRLIWTVHNLEPHDAYRPFLARRFLHWFARQCDGLIFLSEASRRDFLARYETLGRIPFAIVPHGHYRAVYGGPMARQAAREWLGLPANGPVLLLFGMLKPYKNAAGLMEAFRPLANEHVHLVIAGAPASASLMAELKSLAAGIPNVHLIPAFIPDRDVEVYFSAADLVVLPYRHVLNSGVALLALSFDRPLLAPRLGSLEELQADAGPGWVHLYDTPDLQTSILEACLHRLNDRKGDKCDLAAYEWKEIGLKTLAFYETVAQSRRRDSS